LCLDFNIQAQEFRYMKVTTNFPTAINAYEFYIGLEEIARVTLQPTITLRKRLERGNSDGIPCYKAGGRWVMPKEDFKGWADAQIEAGIVKPDPAGFKLLSERVCRDTRKLAQMASAMFELKDEAAKEEVREYARQVAERHEDFAERFEYCSDYWDRSTGLGDSDAQP
jgi:hypothetical protein